MVSKASRELTFISFLLGSFIIILPERIYPIWTSDFFTSHCPNLCWQSSTRKAFIFSGDNSVKDYCRSFATIKKSPWYFWIGCKCKISFLHCLIRPFHAWI